MARGIERSEVDLSLGADETALELRELLVQAHHRGGDFSRRRRVAAQRSRDLMRHLPLLPELVLEARGRRHDVGLPKVRSLHGGRDELR